MMSIIFLIVIICIYKMLGGKTLLFFGYHDCSVGKQIIAGFFVFFFLGFIIGFPCQMFHVSWNVFFLTMCAVFLLLIFWIINKEKKSIREHIDYVKNNKYTVLKQHLQEYWLVYVLALVFTVFSACNTLPYYEMNYDDSYYIGKVVNQIGATHLSVENFFTGAVESMDISFDYRLVNTFEIVYGFLAEIFRIDAVFFCRMSMTLHNYIMIFLLLKVLCSEFMGKQRTQYVLLPFVLLLIPAGFMAYSPDALVTLRMYDAWQFQTAIFYGSSIVRVMAVPAILLYGREMYEKLMTKKIFFLAILFCSFLSFSTIFFEYAIFLVLIFVITKTFMNLLDWVKCNTYKKIVHVFFFVFMMVFVCGLEQVGTVFLTKWANYNEIMQEYTAFFNEYVMQDKIVFFAPYFLTALLFLVQGKKNKGCVITLLFLFLFVRINSFSALYVLASMKYVFVHMRFITSIQLMCIFAIGCVLVYSFNKINLHRRVMSVLGLMAVVSCVTYVYLQRGVIKEFNYLGSGIARTGYQVRNMLQNDQMIPELFVKVGTYFDQLAYGNYRLLSPQGISYDNTTLHMAGLVMSSNRIELFNDYSSDEDKTIVQQFYDDTNVDIVDIMQFIEKERIQYLLVIDEEKMQELSREGYECVLTSSEEKNEYYLMKTNEG